MASVGVWVDIGVSPVFRALRQDLSEWATPISVRLFSGDDTPTTSWSGGTPTELANGDYEPYEVDLTHQATHISPPPPYWSVFGAAFSLGPPEPDNGVVYGWYLGPIDPSSGISYLLAAGRFDPPITIPPAGMTLTIDELRVYLHDCGTSPPPPPPPVRWLDDFLGDASAPLTSHTPQVGSGYTAAQGTFGVQDLVVSSTSNANQDSITFDPGVSDAILNVVLTAQWASAPNVSAPGITFRGIDGRNFWVLLWIGYGASWQLYKVVGGGFVLVGSLTRTANTHESTRLQITLASDTISVSADGQAILSTVDSFGQHATVCGLLQLVIGTATSCQWSHLVVR